MHKLVILLASVISLNIYAGESLCKTSLGTNVIIDDNGSFKSKENLAFKDETGDVVYSQGYELFSDKAGNNEVCDIAGNQHDQGLLKVMCFQMECYANGLDDYEDKCDDKGNVEYKKYLDRVFVAKVTCDT